MDFFSRLAINIKSRWQNLLLRLKAYFKRLLFPLYLFPVKLITYSAYYLVKFSIKLVITLARIIVGGLVFPFKSLKNFLKSLFVIILAVYVVASLFVILDYLRTQYGYYGKFLCSLGAQDKLKASVVRIVGGYSEGSGFFIAEGQVLTNFHVIADEPSPKIIFPDGTFVAAHSIYGNKEIDLAVLNTKYNYPNMVLPVSDNIVFRPEEPLLATGYPLGTDLSGKATVLKGNFIDFRNPRSQQVGYIQTNITLVEGMSGGPLTDICGKVMGVNTMGLAGLSLFINASDANRLAYTMTDQQITKINVDPSVSPEEAVKAYYTYLKARRMRDGFDLLSKDYLAKTNFEEWTTRFKDILDVEIFVSERFENTKDTAFVKFGTKNWVNGEVEIHYYEGTWKTVLEDGVYKMWQSKIKEVEDPGMDWFYEI